MEHSSLSGDFMTARAQRLGLEPGSVDRRIESGDPMERELRHSIAISLKRIADVMVKLYDADEGRS